MKKPVLFVGRWQPCHLGHVNLWLHGAWKNQHPALIYVRDIPPNEKNPFTTEQTVQLIEAAIEDAAGAAEMAQFMLPDRGVLVHPDITFAEVVAASEVIVGPDIAGVAYGRGVGYFVEEIELPADVQAISATEIRTRMKAGNLGWRDFVLPGVGDLLLEMEW